MDDNVKNFNFLKDTVSKFKGEINKLLTNNNYSNTGVIQLKQTVDEIEKNMSSQEKYLVSNYLSNRNKNIQNYTFQNKFSPLPFIKQQNYIPEDHVYISVKYAKQSQIDRMRNPRKKEFNQERMNYINNMKRRKVKGQFEIEGNKRMTSYAKKKNTEKLLNKYGINSDFYDNIKVTCKRPNFMNPEKRLQYSVLNKKFTSNAITYDKNKQPIIRKDELNKGLLNMIYKGLIPKGADLTPAFENEGNNPLQINMKDQSDFDNENIEERNENYNEIKYINNIDDNDNFFITKPNTNIKRPNTDYEIEKRANLIKTDYTKNSKIEESKNITQEKRKVIMFSNFQVIQNDEYNKFHSENFSNWGSISYLFELFSKLFKKLNLALVQVYQDKLLELAKDEMRIIEYKDLLLCVPENELKAKGIDPYDPIKFFSSNKEKRIVTIQMAFRTFRAKKKLYEMRSYFDKIKLIQHMYISSKLMVKARKRAKNLFEKRYKEWKFMMSNFKKKWELVKSMPRVIIHFNSISLTTDNGHMMNSTFDQFNQRENNQINRIIDLYDTNVEIVYITPYEINQDIISYYTSIMNTLGVENVKERFHVLIPDILNHIPKNHNYSVSELLLLSTETLNQIKRIIGEKEAYIIPGNGGKIEVELSIILNCPIFMGDLFQVETIFTKSGAKLIFEANEVHVPISAWDIKDEIEFYSSLSHLISSYPNYNIWVFKMDNEIQGRGIAYIQLDKIQPYLDLKKKKEIYENKVKFEELLSEVLKNMIPKKVKICANYLYKSWEEYFEDYLKYRGIIEACPTYNPGNIVGSPAFPILIEPNGNIEHLPSYDKINLFSFRNIGAISPQKSIQNIKKNENESISKIDSINNNNNSSYNLNDIDLNLIGEKIGKYLYEHDIIGYVTIELIAFRNYRNTNTNESEINYWAIDIKFGLNDLLSSIKFCHFIYSHAMDKLQVPDINMINLSLNNERIMMNDKCEIFTFPFLSHPRIAEIQMKDLVKEFRNENLIFDVEKRKGIVFNFSDVLECGNMGVCGILNLEDVDLQNDFLELWKMIQNSLHIIAIGCKLNDFQPMMIEDQRTDILDIADIFNKVNKFYNNLLIYEKRKDNSGDKSNSTFKI